MAYPSVSGPYGLVPINLIGGQVFAGATRQIPIATNSSTAIYFGDVVLLNSGGTLDRDAGTTTATPVGVFLGCSYTDPTFGKTFRQYYPGTTSVTDVVAYVQDDPDALYKAAVVLNYSSTAISYVNRTSVGNNGVLSGGVAGNAATGNSRIGVTSTTATTSTWPVRIIDVVPETQSASGSYTEVIVKWNQGMHQYLNPTGV